MIPLSFYLETERMILRCPSAEDIPAIFEATRYEGFNDGMRWNPPQSITELNAPLQRNLKCWKEGEAYVFTMAAKKDDQLIGRISIHKKEGQQFCRMGFWTHPKHQSQGFMTEAVAAVLQFGFQKLEAERIEASYVIWNKASQRVLEKNGMTFLKFIKNGFEKNGKWVDLNLMSISKKQFAEYENL